MKQIHISIAALCISLSVSSSFSQLKEGDRVEQSTKIPIKDGEFRLMEVKDATSGKLLFSNIGCAQFPKKDAPATPPDGRYDQCLRFGDIRSGEIKLGFMLTNVDDVLNKVYRGVQAAPSNSPLPTDHRQILAVMEAANTTGQNILNNPKNLGTSPEGITTYLYPTQSVVRLSSNEQVGMRNYFVALVDSKLRLVAMQLTGLRGQTTELLGFSGITLGASKSLVMDTLGLPSSVQDVPQIKGKQWNYSPFPFSIEFKDNVVYSIRVTTPTPESLRMGFTPLKSIPE